MPPTSVLPANRSSVLRGLVVTLGILAGLCVYSYGMFHTLLPTWANIADVAHCGVAPGLAYQAYDARTLGQSDLPLCEVTPGRWVRTPYGNGPLWLALAIAFGTTMLALHRSPLLKSAITSAARTVTLFLLIFGVPMVLLGLHLNFVEGTLTSDWAVHTVLYGMLSGAAMGAFAWYVLVRPLRARATSNNRWRGP